ncbi:M20 family metallopeptidase [Actinosynnema sp. NPDC047251]|uniref:M20 family metallopeptidase n=1 Tax=Saccharothrix espanaensis TaxID=103731 RepID=UPI00059E4943|nr:M20 family metallopeptidase [Saccharothrix espanaensis]
MPELLADIETLVRKESPSSDEVAVAESADLVAALGARVLGVEPERIGPHLRWRLGDGPSRVVLVGHHDTVWPIGSLATHPFSVRDGVLRGPGCFDMKTGVVMALHAVAALADRTGVTVLVTGDEELGSPSSRELVEESATGCAAAFVLEAAAGTSVKTVRKGVSLYEVRAIGKAAHAGLEPELGVSAAIEVAHQLLAVAALSSPEVGTTVTPTLTQAGTTTNTVAAAGSFFVDVRVTSLAEQQRIDERMHELTPVVPGATLEVLGGPNRPPLPSSASSALFARAQRLGAELGLDPITGVEVGGASDGNFTAGVGTPTLDGLGACGGGAHADHEHVLVEHIPGRTALLVALVDEVLRETV